MAGCEVFVKHNEDTGISLVNIELPVEIREEDVTDFMNDLGTLLENYRVKE